MIIIIVIVISIIIIVIAIAGAHNPEWATPILGLCHGVFTDQFIIRHVLGHFFPVKTESPPCLWAHSKYKVSKSKTKCH